MTQHWGAVILGTLLSLAMGLGPGGWALAAPPVAVLVETTPGVTVRTRGVADPATLLQLLEVDIELQVSAKAHAVVLYLRSGDQQVLTGPGTARVGANQLLPVDGTAPVVRRPAQGQEIRLRPERLAQGGVALRSVPAPAPALNAVEIERRRPARDAPLGERVAYALWLEDAGAWQDARAAWRALAAEWPDQPALAERAAR